MSDGHRSGRSTGRVSCKSTELKRCSVIEMRWNKYEVSLASPVWTQIRRPSSEKKFRVVELKTPRFSTARPIGSNLYVCIIINIFTPVLNSQGMKKLCYAIEKVHKSSWNEPYSSSCSFTKQSCNKMALYRWVGTESRCMDDDGDGRVPARAWSGSVADKCIRCRRDGHGSVLPWIGLGWLGLGWVGSGLVRDFCRLAGWVGSRLQILFFYQ